MDVGFSLSIRRHPDEERTLAQIYEDNLQDVEYAEELGFTHVWNCEHHFAWDQWSPAQFPVLATIAARTSRIRMGTVATACRCWPSPTWSGTSGPWSNSSSRSVARSCRRGTGGSAPLPTAPAKYHGLSGHDLEIIERVAQPVVAGPENVAYLRTKRDRMGHLLDLSAGA